MAVPSTSEAVQARQTLVDLAEAAAALEDEEAEAGQWERLPYYSKELASKELASSFTALAASPAPCSAAPMCKQTLQP